MDGTGTQLTAFAAELARRRAEAGLSLAEVATAAHVARGYVHHIEHGHRRPSRTVARALDAAVGADGALVAIWQGTEHPTRRRSERPASRSVIGPLPVPADAARVPADVEALRAMARAFQTADRQVGGGRLYPALLRFLHTEVAPALIDPGSDGSGELFAAAASLTEIAGWMAHDSGADDAARNHFGRAYRLATTAGSDALAGNVCASMAHLAVQLGRSVDAVRIAEVGLGRAARADGAAWLVARLHAMRAHGLALDRQVDATTAALGTAERSLAAAGGTEPAEWIAHFDEGALAGVVALCQLEIGDLTAAERAARRVIELRDGDRVRSRAFGQLTLARVLFCNQRHDEAALLGRAVCDVVPSLTSTRVRSRLAALPAYTVSNSEPTWPV